MEVVELNIVGNDISGGLRHLADRIDAGEYPDLQFVQALAVTRDASFTCFAWGSCSVLETMGAMARALARDLVDES